MAIRCLWQRIKSKQRLITKWYRSRSWAKFEKKERPNLTISENFEGSRWLSVLLEMFWVLSESHQEIKNNSNSFQTWKIDIQKPNIGRSQENSWQKSKCSEDLIYCQIEGITRQFIRSLELLEIQYSKL